MKEKVYKKWWFWCIIIFCVCIIILFSENNSENEINETNQIKETQNMGKSYILTGSVLGDYGKQIILNKNTDMPTEKYIYKIPAGDYTATTNNDKITSFYIIKDKIKTNKGEKYPEELEYVQNEAYLLTKSDDKTNDTIKKEIQFTLNEDESILIIGSDTLIIKSR